MFTRKILVWLKNHPLHNWAILISYFLFCVVYHEQAQQPFFWLVEKKGQIFLNLFMTGLFILLLIAGGFALVTHIIRHPERNKLIFFWSITLFLTSVAYLTLMPYNSEAVHFPQYALLAFLLVPRFENLLNALLLSSIAGYADEIFQYFYRNKIYLDFNDFVLNFLGSAIGVLIAYSVWPDLYKRYENWKGQLKSPLLIFYQLFFLMAFTGLATGIIGYFSDGGHFIHLIAGIRECHYYYLMFDTPWGKSWHQILPFEGIIISMILPLAFLKLDPFRHE